MLNAFHLSVKEIGQNIFLLYNTERSWDFFILAERIVTLF